MGTLWRCRLQRRRVHLWQKTSKLADWKHTVCVCVCVCVVHWHCTAQLSMFNMEKRFRNKIIIIIIIIGLDVVHDFVYLGSTISDTLSLDAELNKRIGKAATIMTRLTKKIGNNSKLTEHTIIQIYRACAVSTLLYGSESWTLRARQERKLNAFHMRSLRRILNITWQDKVPDNTVLERAGCTSLYTLLKQRRMRCMARPCHANGRRTHPQRPPLRTDCAEITLQVRRDTRSAARGKENEKKGCSPGRQNSVRLRLCPLPQGLSFPRRTGQSHPTLYQNKHL